MVKLSVTMGWGFQISRKQHYVTLEWPLSRWTLLSGDYASSHTGALPSRHTSRSPSNQAQEDHLDGTMSSFEDVAKPMLCIADQQYTEEWSPFIPFLDDVSYLYQRLTASRNQHLGSSGAHLPAQYLRDWCLRHSIVKTVSTAYHLHKFNRELVETRELQKYLRLCLNKMPNFKQYIEDITVKVTSSVSLVVVDSRNASNKHSSNDFRND